MAPKPDARKLKTEAAEAIAKGRWKRAAEAFAALEELEPKEGAWPQKQGEMLERLGQRDEAVAALARASNVYSDNGFLLKAVAVCKVILDLDPGHRQTTERLAALHAARARPAGESGGFAARPEPAAGPAPRAGAPGPGASSPFAAAPPAERSPFEAPPIGEVPLAEVVPGARKADGVEAQDIPVYSPEVTPVRALLPRTPLFSALDELRLRMLIERVRLVELAPGEAAFHEGDEPDALYVVVQGEVAVLVQGKGAAPVEVARLGEGAFFGEIALVARQKRSATVQATVETRLLALDRVAATALVHGSPSTLKILLGFLRDRLVDTLVDTNPLFAPLAGEERVALAARFHFLELEPGAVLIEQGRRAPGLFALLAGRAEVLLDGRLIATLGSGDLCGEMSLLAGGAAVATVRAAAKTFAVQLPRADFQDLVMSHPQVLEFVGALAEERRALLEAIRKGKAEWGEGHLPVS